MLTITIQVSGDQWNNRSNVKEMLDQTKPGDSVMLDLCSEGPSLRKLGIVDLLDQYNLKVFVTRWSNPIETVPYQRVHCNATSHFFPMSYHYWVDDPAAIPGSESKFALFLGRSCPSRNRILYDVFHQHRDDFLLSKLPSNHKNTWGYNSSTDILPDETVEHWFDNVESAQEWFDNCPVGSIDNRTVQDQFLVPEISAGEMARSLLGHYHKFDVELICETYTQGETFFPTEKTVRPMVGNKTFLVYGPVGYLNNLQKRGFRTFNELWDESYDQLEGRERWQAINQLIENLIDLPNDTWVNMMKQCQAISKHNKTIVRKMIRDLKGI
jgi:hypothetical protein